jgi:hypothetical protein
MRKYIFLTKILLELSKLEAREVTAIITMHSVGIKVGEMTSQ